MDKKEAKNIILDQLKTYRSKPYNELVRLIDNEPITYEVISQSERKYQIEIQAFWDDKPTGTIRIIGSIDDGGIRACFPLSEDFIKSPNNEFIGE